VSAANWEETIVQLERATARLKALPADDIAGIAEAMTERSTAILRLRDLAVQAPAVIPRQLLDRLKEDWRAGAAASKKLLLVRAATQSEYGRILEAAFLARSLQSGRAAARRRIDCTG
jgi:hypothetical protein